MRKKFGICLVALLSYLLFFASGLIAGTKLLFPWMPLVIGGGFFIVAIGFLIGAAKKKGKWGLVIASVIAGGIGCGLSASAYYIHINVFSLVSLSVLLDRLLMSAGLSVGFYLLYSLSLNLRFLEKHIKIYTYPVMISGLITLGILWGVKDSIFYSLLFFFFLLVVLFIFPLIIVAKDGKELVLHIAFAALGAFLLVTVIVLIVISEGDGFDLDFGGGSGSHLPVENPHKSKINDIDILNM